LLSQSIDLFFSLWYIYFIFGMVFGSFLNVVIYRVPNGLSIISPPSSCPKCGHVIKWYENIPVLSWIFLKGRCSECRLPISIEYPVVELSAGLITSGLFFHFGPSIQLLIYIPLAYTLFCILIIDFKTYSIPHGLNITLFVICLSGSILNIIVDRYLNSGIIHSVSGALTGFLILYLIQIAGKLIYKQDALGTGDLFLLGSAGLLLGPKLTLTAFFLGSLAAVISYSIPALINLKKQKQQALYFKNTADGMQLAGFENDDEKIDVLGLKLQLYYNLADERFDSVLKDIQNLTEDKELKNLSFLRLFFRFLAIGLSDKAAGFLQALDLKSDSLVSDIGKVINEDLIGYDSPKDNFSVLLEYSKKVNIKKLSEMLMRNKDSFIKEEFETYNKIEEISNSISDDDKKLEFLLKHNRLFQFNGYTAEQKKITELIEKSVDLTDEKNNQRYLSELSYVYFKDFYFDQSRSAFEILIKNAAGKPVNAKALKAVYNISLFRIAFYKQRLAFGPFLALGILVSLIYGERLINLYFNFLEKMFM